MRQAQGIVGATLLYGPNDPSPDLVSAMQFLVDDLRAEGRRISGLRLGARSLRLRADEFEIALTLTEGPLSPRALAGISRPGAHLRDMPDLARARLIRNLQTHNHALGIILRRRGAPPPDPDALAQDLAQRGRLSLLPVFEAAPPCLLIWQPGGLLFTTAEFLSIDAAELMIPPDPQAPLLIALQERGLAQRPGPGERPSRPTMANRFDRSARRSAGRLFGTQPPNRPHPLPQLAAQDDRLTAALRAPTAATARPPSRRLPVVAVAALWGLLAQTHLVGWLPL